MTIVKIADLMKKELKIQIDVEKEWFLHIGAAPSPLEEKKGSVFKIDGNPVIPASSFKGALRSQLEKYFSLNSGKIKKIFNNDSDDLFKPCIPTDRPSKGEQFLISSGKYRGKMLDKKYSNCGIKVTIDTITTKDKNLGICPVCYFLGATGIMGFIRVSNFHPTVESSVLDFTNIRIDRSTGTAAEGAIVTTEQVKENISFIGTIEIIEENFQGFKYGYPRIIHNYIIDKWMANWNEVDSIKRKDRLNEILTNAITSIQWLGGHKSKGAGKISCKIITG